MAEQEALESGIVTSGEIEVFHQELINKSDLGHFFSYGNVILASATKR